MRRNADAVVPRLPWKVVRPGPVCGTRGFTLTPLLMPLRFRHLPVLLAVAALGACSAESITGAPATAELPQPQPSFSHASGSGSAPAVVAPLARVAYPGGGDGEALASATAWDAAPDARTHAGGSHFSLDALAE